MESVLWFNGPVRFAIAPFSLDTGATACPDKTVEYGEAYPAPWVDLSQTQGGIQFTPNFENRDVDNDQHDGPVAGRRVTNGATLVVPLLNGLLGTIKRLIGQGDLTEGALETVLSVGDKGVFLDYYSVVMEGLAPGSEHGAEKYRRLYLPKVSPNEAPEMAMTKTEETVVSSTFKAYVDPAQAKGERLWKLIDDVEAGDYS